jgi:protein-tyrosine phosphatase
LNFIDIHCHILPGMDDGPATMEESLRMLDIAMKDGITSVFATPHIIPGAYDNTKASIIAALRDLKGHLPDSIEVFYGADVRVSVDLLNRIEEGEVPTLNNSGYLLVELPEFIVPPNLDILIFNLKQKGFVPVITHPERNPHIMRDLGTLFKLKTAGALTQLTAMSITGDFGKDIRRTSFAIIESELADIVASDAHNEDARPPVLSKAYKTVKKEFGDESADMFFMKNPKMILKQAILNSDT